MLSFAWVRILTALLVLLALLGLYGYLVEPRWLRIRHRVVWLPNWDSRLDGLRILHLSDIHLRSQPTFVDKHLKGALTEEADNAVITGDFIANPRDLDGSVRALRSALGGRTVYAILGNHEYAEYGFSIPIIQQWNVLRHLDTVQVSGALEKVGLTMLRNGSVSVPFRSMEVVLAGVDDMFNHAMDLDKALRVINGLTSTVLRCHSLDVLEEASRRGLPLVLSGHTHGGQIRLPFIGALTTGKKYPMERACGILRHGNTTMHVSPGLGLSFPLRLLTRPEATVLELRTGEGSQSTPVHRGRY